MNVKVQDIEKNVVQLEIEVDADTFEEGMKKSFIKNAKQFNVPGFRKGKAPRSIIERYYGEQVLYEDAINAVCPDAYDKAVEENDAYLLSVIRYIHNNPVKAGITKRSEDYAWSSYNKYLNPSEPDEIVETQTILSMFSDDEHTALKNFIKFSTEPTNEEFMDINNNLEIPEKPVENKKLIVEQLLKANGCKLREVKTLKDKERRNELLRIIKQRSLISSRELSKILGISKDIIFRS
jgi:hypothetical protein